MAKKLKAHLGAKVESSKWELMFRLSKVFVDPLRMMILAECNMREMSPKMFFDEFGGGTLSRVSRAFEVLEKYDWLYLTRTETGGCRRGGVEHFYRATGPAILDETTWPDVPESMRNFITWRILESFTERVKEAMKSGTIDARTDRHFSWMPLLLDREGWENVIRWIDELFYRVLKEQKEASRRLARSGEEPVPMTVALAGFESPKNAEKLP